ncbi:FG-GAP-like repeat-containing protein [Streptomyces sp. NBC_00539]|uniref:FG-GAP-like repeat-containing protein n=1 Tax=Streptomyces sp. NBC_00539 TaxID=2975770 RepID=UPI002E8200AE|nr:FG-GAP-like repeat-containing protein [Streptomyces sp. NBC_00539]WUC62965.1 FG-GAP-like repeat-containing protein [Streptomyces sp. NBC_00539]
MKTKESGRGRGTQKGRGAALAASALCALYAGTLTTATPATATLTAAVPQDAQSARSPQAPAPGTAAAAPALLAEPALRVVSWNICGEAGGVRGEDGFCAYRNEPQQKVDQIARVAAEHDANVIMLQEVCGEAPGSHMERLRAALGTGWSIEHAKGARPDGTTYCRGGLGGELGVGIAVKGRVSEVTAVNTVPSGGDLQTLPILCVRVEGWSPRACTTHILADGADPRRSGQIQNVKSAIWPDRNQIVLGGDFNMFPGSPDLQPISEAFDECDRRAYGDGDEVNEVTHHSWSAQGGHQLRKRDHIFASRSESGSPFTACDVDRSLMDTTENRSNSGPPNGYSDHAPVIGHLRPVKHTEVAGDFNGDGRADLAVLSGQGKSADGRNQTSLWMFSGTATGFAAPRRVWDSGTDSWNWAASTLTAGDFDGDGKADLGVLYDYGRSGDRNRTGLWTFKGTAQGVEAPRKAWDSQDDPANPDWNWNASKPVAADFDGDGKADVGVLYDYGSSGGSNRTGLRVFTGTGTGFKNPRQLWDSRTDPVKSWNWAASKPVAGDFDGDGRADLGVLYDYGRTGDRNRTGLWTFTATGNGFAGPRQVWDSSTDSWNWAASKPVAGDFDGDGRADLGVLYDYGRTGDRNRTGLWTFSATGNGFGGPRKVWDSADGGDSWSWAASSPAAGDFNGDGRVDLGVLYDSGNASNGRNQTRLWAFTSRGAEFGAPRRYWDSSLNG